MAKNIDPNLRKIGEYLNIGPNKQFLIPDYQRAYSWTKSQCDKLWQDILDAMEVESSDPYFFGTIITNNQEDDTILSLIDGQQRTTTFILLLRALLLKLNESVEQTMSDRDSQRLNSGLTLKRNAIIKILYKATDEEVFDIVEDFSVDRNKVILRNESINEIYKDELNTILFNRTYDDIKESVYKIPRKQKDNKYTNFFRNFDFFYQKLSELSNSELNMFTDYILNKSEIIEIKSWNVDQAITMFNSLNSDGMPLQDADIIAAKLYAKAGDSNTEFKENWEEFNDIEESLDSLKIADKDSMLNQLMYIKRAVDRETISDGDSIIVTTPGIRRYYTDIRKDLLTDPITLSSELVHIAKIWDKIKSYTIITILSLFNKNYRLFLMPYLFKFDIEDIDEKLVTEIGETLLRLFSVLEIQELVYSSNKFKTFLFRQNLDFVRKDISLDEIKTNFDKHIGSQWTYEQINTLIKEYTKRPLVVLNEYLYAKEVNNNFSINDGYEIEHIIPKSGRNIENIRKDTGIVDEEFFKSKVEELGNKMLLEEKINKSIGNAWFRSKLETSIEDKSGYKDSKFPTAQYFIAKYEDVDKAIWTFEDVDQRTDKIADRITKFIFN